MQNLVAFRVTHKVVRDVGQERMQNRAAEMSILDRLEEPADHV